MDDSPGGLPEMAMPEEFEALQTPSPAQPHHHAAPPAQHAPPPSLPGSTPGIASPTTPEEAARRRHEAAYDFVSCVKVKIASIRGRVVRLSASDTPAAVKGILEEEEEVATLLEEIGALSTAMQDDEILQQQLSIAREDIEDLLQLVRESRNTQAQQPEGPSMGYDPNVIINIAARMGPGGVGELRNLQATVPRSWFESDTAAIDIVGPERLGALFASAWPDAPVQWRAVPYLWQGGSAGGGDEGAFVQPFIYTPDMLLGEGGAPPQFYLVGTEEPESPRSGCLAIQSLPPPVPLDGLQVQQGMQHLQQQQQQQQVLESEGAIPPEAMGFLGSPEPLSLPQPPVSSGVGVATPQRDFQRDNHHQQQQQQQERQERQPTQTPPRDSPHSTQPRALSSPPVDTDKRMITIRVATRLQNGSGPLVNYELPIPEYWLHEDEAVGEKFISEPRLGSLLHLHWPQAPQEWRAVPHWWHCRRGCFVLEEPYDVAALGPLPQFYLLGIWETDEDSPRTRGLALDELPPPLRVGEAVAGGGGGGVAGGAEEGGPDWAALFAEFYRRHNPAKIDNVPALLSKYQHEEQQLWNMLLNKYSLTNESWNASPQRVSHPPAQPQQQQQQAVAVPVPQAIPPPQQVVYQSAPPPGMLPLPVAQQRAAAAAAAASPAAQSRTATRSPGAGTPSRRAAEVGRSPQSAATPQQPQAAAAAPAPVAVPVPPTQYSVDWAARISEFYKVHNPEKVPKVPQLLRQFAGEEENLWIALQNQYCPNETLPRRPAQQDPAGVRSPEAAAAAAAQQQQQQQQPRPSPASKPSGGGRPAGRVGQQRVPGPARRVGSPSRSASSGAVPRKPIVTPARAEPAPNGLSVRAPAPVAALDPQGSVGAPQGGSLPRTAPLMMQQQGGVGPAGEGEGEGEVTPIPTPVRQLSKTYPKPRSTSSGGRRGGPAAGTTIQRKPDVPRRSTTPTQSRAGRCSGGGGGGAAAEQPGTGVNQPRWTSLSSQKVAEAAQKLERRKHQTGNPGGKIPNWNTVKPRTEAGKRKYDRAAQRDECGGSARSTGEEHSEVEIPPPQGHPPITREQAEVDDGMPNPLSPQHHDSEQRRMSPRAPRQEGGVHEAHELHDVSAVQQEPPQVTPPTLPSEAIPAAVQRAMQQSLPPTEVVPEVRESSEARQQQQQHQGVVPKPQVQVVAEGAPPVRQVEQQQPVQPQPTRQQVAGQQQQQQHHQQTPPARKAFSKKAARGRAEVQAAKPIARARSTGTAPSSGGASAEGNAPPKRQFYVAPRPRSRTPNRDVPPADAHEREAGWKSPMTRGGHSPLTAMQRFEMDLWERGFQKEAQAQRAEQMRKAESKAMKILERQTHEAELRNHRLEVLLQREEELERKRERIRLDREVRQRATREWQMRKQPTSVHVTAPYRQPQPALKQDHRQGGGAPVVPPLFASPAAEHHYDPSVPAWDPRAQVMHNNVISRQLYQQAHQLADDYENL